MDLEKIATSAVVTEISKTDRLSCFINSGDKEPCWDGNIYIHEDNSRSKKNIKKVATQVKGKAVHSKKVGRTISYSASYDDLHAYMMDGGVLFFVVHINKDDGNAKQIYYSGLLPIKIKEILKVKKGKYSIKFHKFPTDKLRKTELLINFYQDTRRQASFAGKELPTIDDLAKEGVLESVSIHYTGLSKNVDHYGDILPKHIEGQSLTLYAKIKGCSAEIPVEYVDSVTQFTMSNRNTLPVSVNGRPYYVGFQTITTADWIEHRIGSSVKLILPNVESKNDPVPLSLKIKIQGTLTQQITAIEFVLAMIEHGSFTIGTCEIPVTFTQKELDRIKAFDYPEILKGYNRAKTVLRSMNVKKDLDIDKCTEEDLRKLNLLIGSIGDNLPVRGNPANPATVQKITIANLTLAVVYLKNQAGGYRIFDYFGNHFDVSWAPDGSEPAEVSQFFSMGADDYLTLDNLNLKTILDDFKRVNASMAHLELGNNTMLTMLSAYDRGHSTELLDAARQLCDWIQEYPEYIPNDITTLNRLQIALRERALTFQERTELYNIANTATDPFYKIGAFLLLDEQKEAQAVLDTLTEDEFNRLKAFPIFKFYRNSEEDETNGQTQDALTEQGE